MSVCVHDSDIALVCIGESECQCISHLEQRERERERGGGLEMCLCGIHILKKDIKNLFDGQKEIFSIQEKC